MELEPYDRSSKTSFALFLRFRAAEEARAKANEGRKELYEGKEKRAANAEAFAAQGHSQVESARKRQERIRKAQRAVHHSKAKAVYTAKIAAYERDQVSERKAVCTQHAILTACACLSLSCDAGKRGERAGAHQTRLIECDGPEARSSEDGPIGAIC